jgi:hypothetical protein
VGRHNASRTVEDARKGSGSVKDRPNYRSYSQLTEWMKCGESFRLSRRVGIKEKPSVWLPGGTAFHTTTERYDRDELSNGSLTQTWAEEWNRAVAEQIENAPDEFKDPATWRVAGKGKETLDWWKSNGEDWVRKYAAWRNASGLELVEHGVEVEMMPVLADVPVKMFADRVFADQHGQILVVDLKTGASDQPSSLQLGVYKVGLEKLVGLPVEWGAFYNARKGELYPPVRLDQWTEERIAALFATFDAQEKAGQYLPNIGSHCKYMCSMRQWCVYQGGERHPEDE